MQPCLLAELFGGDPAGPSEVGNTRPCQAGLIFLGVGNQWALSMNHGMMANPMAHSWTKVFHLANLVAGTVMP